MRTQHSPHKNSYTPNRNTHKGAYLQISEGGLGGGKRGACECVCRHLLLHLLAAFQEKYWGLGGVVLRVCFSWGVHKRGRE